MSKKVRAEKEIVAEPLPSIKDYTTSRGKHILLVGIPPLKLPRLATLVEWPTKPTYIVETAGGDKEIHDHDENSVKGDPAAELAWLSYIQANERAEEEMLRAMLSLVIEEGMDVDVPQEELLRWKKRQERIGFQFESDDPEDLIHFYKEDLLADRKDIESVVDIVLKLSGLDQEALTSMKKTFPDQV